MKVRIKNLSENAVIPERKTDGSIGYDLVVPNDTPVVGRRMTIPLGFAIEMPYGIEAKIEPRSGCSCKGLPIENDARLDADVLVGKIDPDYRGEVNVIIINHAFPCTGLIKAGTRIAQMTFYKVEFPKIEISDELSESARGECGFGSTGER